MVIASSKAALVLNKPPGLATQGGTKTTRHVDGLLDAFIDSDDEPRPRLVHRLDKDTSGVLLIARTPGSAAFFSKRFSGRSAKKIYWALVVGVPEVAEGTIEAPLAKQPGTGGEKMHVDQEGGQPAKTRYRVVDKVGKKAAWVELEPLTGRTHQLRVHCAAIGNPIVGDGKYGGQDAFLTGTISRKMHLHARRLIIDAPGGDTIDATAALPEHFAASMEQLGFDTGSAKPSPCAIRRPSAAARRKSRPHASTPSNIARRAAASGAGGRPRPAPPRQEARLPRQAGPQQATGQALMHPNPLFRSEDRALFEALIDEIGFGMVFLTTPDGPACRTHAAALDRRRRGAIPSRARQCADPAPRRGECAGHDQRARRLCQSALVRQSRHGADLGLCRAGTGRPGAADGHGRAGRPAPRADPAPRGPRRGRTVAREEASEKLWRSQLAGIAGFELEVLAWRPTIKLSQKRSRRRARDDHRRARERGLASPRHADAEFRGMSEVRLAVFDCDGTLVDGQAAICECMELAFAAADLPRPTAMRCAGSSG